MHTTILTLDPQDRRPLNPIWSFGANTCHAPLWFRSDLQQHLRRSQRELGFRYVRCHGILNDDMDVVRSDGSFHFERVIAAIEALRACGLKPFIELSSMPGAFAAGETHLTSYKFRSDPPKDWTRWYALIRAMVEALAAHFGREELRTWYFEVWNEPDINFWTGTQADYFRLYDLAARAIKEVDAGFRVGGPATSKTAWVEPFLAHILKPSADDPRSGPRCDFVSTHAYPSDLAYLDADRGAVTLLNSNIMLELFTEVRRQVDAALGAGFPVICGEWNSSAGPLVENHDESNNAAFVAKTMTELSDVCQGSLYWNLSDIYEESGFHFEPFHGGYGLLTVNDVPKAPFHAFAFLREHDGGARIGCQMDGAPTGVGALATVEGGVTRVLLYHYVEPDGPKPRPVRVCVEGLPGGMVSARGVSPGGGSAFETWVELGRPPYVNREILDRLTKASQPRRARAVADGKTWVLHPGSILQIVAGGSS